MEAKKEKKSNKNGKAVVTKPVGTNIVSSSRRGVIKGKLPVLAARLGGKLTNADYAKANGEISARQASKIRSGKKTA